MSNENRKMVNLNDRQGQILIRVKAQITKELKQKSGWTGTLYEGDVLEWCMDNTLGIKHTKGT